MLLRLAKRETAARGVKECGQKKRRGGKTGDFRPFLEKPHDQIGGNVTLNNGPLDERRVAGLELSRYTMIQDSCRPSPLEVVRIRLIEKPLTFPLRGKV